MLLITNYKGNNFILNNLKNKFKFNGKMILRIKKFDFKIKLTLQNWKSKKNVQESPHFGVIKTLKIVCAHISEMKNAIKAFKNST